jgi:hypothetical protein
MANKYRGNILQFEVQDGSKKATVAGNWTPLPPTTTPHPGPFKLSNDSDTEFLAMCDVCAAAEVAGRQVTITVTSGDADEIDIISV